MELTSVYDTCKICGTKLAISTDNSKYDQETRFNHLNLCHQLYYALQVKHINEDKTVNYFDKCNCEYCKSDQNWHIFINALYVD